MARKELLPSGVGRRARRTPDTGSSRASQLFRFANVLLGGITLITNANPIPPTPPGNAETREKMKSSNTLYKNFVGGLLSLLLALAFVGTASADNIDGFTATINPTPTTDITSGLNPDSVDLNGYYAEDYTAPSIPSVIDNGLGGGLFQSAWYQGTAPGTTNQWGATNPFGNTSLEYDGVYNGVATYDYGAPESALTILWGTPSSDNKIEFFDQGDTQIGNAINGGSVINDVPGFMQPASVDLTIQVPQDFYAIEVIGGGSTFEYSNLVATAVVVPEPSTYALVLGGLGLLAFWRHRTRRGLPASFQPVG